MCVEWRHGIREGFADVMNQETECDKSTWVRGIAGSPAVLREAHIMVADRTESDLTKPALFSLKGGEAYDAKYNLTWQRCSVGQRQDEGAGCLGTPI
jgi:hypothetical protein